MTSVSHMNAGPVSVIELPLEARFNLRCRQVDKRAVEEGLGFPLPVGVGGVGGKGSRRALCLGPDEWQVDTTSSDGATLVGAMAGVSAAFSLVDVTDREMTWRLSGQQSAALLSAGIARDLSKIAPQSGCRTVFDGVQAILFRESEADWTLSVWRSFAPHARHLIDTVNEEFASGL